jgi:hypothetical protein
MTEMERLDKAARNYRKLAARMPADMSRQALIELANECEVRFVALRMSLEAQGASQPNEAELVAG